MTLSKMESATNEIFFGFLTTTVIFLVASVLTFLHVPIILTFLATLFMCKVYWFPAEVPEIPVMSLCRGGVNLFFLINIYLLALFSGSFFARKVTLTDAYELYRMKWVTSEKIVTVYLTYNFVYWITILLFVHTFRSIENFFTSLAGAVRDKMNERRGGAHPHPTTTTE